ncbi:MAG TPA: PQQ-binding-like beta-propeller repeat protein [Solirubrobacteraceae bacterium]|jgi:hypothetical protein
MRAALGVLTAMAVMWGGAVARAADETTQELVNPAHTSSVPDSPLEPPLKLRWQANLGHIRSNVVVSGGRVFYVRRPGTGNQLTALSTADGSILWSQDGSRVSGIAIDGGRLFTIGPGDPDGSDANVRVRALDPADGSELWVRDIASSYGPASKLTADDGQLFFAADSGNTALYAVRQSDGKDIWPPKTLVSGTYSTPALDDTSVYVSMAGDQTFAFRRADGLQRWHHDSGISGGGGTSPVIHNGLLYGDWGNIHQTSDGLIVGSWSTLPAWSGDVGVTGLESDSSYSYAGLRGIGPGYGDTRWTTEFPAYGPRSWLIAGQYVYAGTGYYGYELHALRLGDGAKVWCTTVDMPAGSWTGSADDEAVLPLAAGDGLLLVEAGYGLAAFESGGPPSSCDSQSGGGSGTTTTNPPVPAVSHPALDLDLERTDAYVGERVPVSGQVLGMPITAGQEVVAEVDEWPFDGDFRLAGTDRASDGGFVSFTLRPQRNVQVRLRLGSDSSVVSGAETVWADFPTRIVRRGAGGPRPRVRATLYALPGAEVSRRVVHGYLLRRGWTQWRRVASRRWQRRGRVTFAATLRYPRGTLRRRDRVLLCTREPTPDAYGEPTPYDALCGARLLARSLR